MKSVGIERSGSRTAGQVKAELTRAGAAGRAEARRRQAPAQRCEHRRRTGEAVHGRASLQAEAARKAVAEKAGSEVAGVEVEFYRKYTEAMLRRYLKLRMQAGRVPSPMDKEIFRGRMSHYKVHGFDDAVIFCVDVERCLARLNGEDQRLLRRIAVQEYSMGEAAGVLGMSLRSCIVLYQRALDRTTRLFLEARLLERENGCQAA